MSSAALMRHEQNRYQLAVMVEVYPISFENNSNILRFDSQVLQAVKRNIKCYYLLQFLHRFRGPVFVCEHTFSLDCHVKYM